MVDLTAESEALLESLRPWLPDGTNWVVMEQRFIVIEQAAADRERARWVGLADALEAFLREQRAEGATNRCQCEDDYPWDGIHRAPCLWEATHGLRAAHDAAARVVGGGEE